MTAQRLARHMAEGLDKGENLNDLVKRIQRELGANRNRALKIARTQTGGAVGTGRHEGFKGAGLELKAWLSAKDENTRHLKAEEQYKDGIPVDQPFILGGDFLMYPGDPGGSPANVVNCRCVEIAVKAKGKQYTLADYANVKFYSYQELMRAQSCRK